MPQTTVNLPDGRRIHFPEGMPLEQVQAEVGKLTGAPTQSAAAPAQPAQKPSNNSAAALRLLGIRPGVIGQSDPLSEGVTGAAKGAAGSAYNVARGVSMALPGSSLSLPPKPSGFEPKTTAEKVGHGIEQVAEFFAPAGLVGKVAGMAPKAQAAAKIGAEAIGAAGVSAAQGGNPLTAAALSGATGAASKLIGKAVPALKEAAEKRVVQALGPTKERFKAMARRIAPEILKRGLGGSRQSLMQRAAAAAETAGEQIDEAIQAFGSRQVGTQPVMDALEKAKDAFRITNSFGNVVEIEKRAIGQLTSLQRTVNELGPGATVEQLRAIRMAWDRVVDQAGGFAHRAAGAISVPLKDQSEAWAKREGAGAIRKLLAQEVPELAAVNKEFAFWKSLEDVLGQTLKRTEPQGPGLGRRVAEVAGAAAGSGHGLGAAFLTGKLAQAAQAAFTSPRWRLLDARIRDGLADAIQSGSSTRVALALARVNAAIGSSVGGGSAVPGAPKVVDSSNTNTRERAGKVVDSVLEGIVGAAGLSGVPTPGTNGLDTTASRVGELLAAAAPLAGIRKGIRAFHGSPHDFDKFKMEKIGTGEGAQAYGHGLYFSENEGVARSYKNALTGTNKFGNGYTVPMTLDDVPVTSRNWTKVREDMWRRGDKVGAALATILGDANRYNAQNIGQIKKLYADGRVSRDFNIDAATWDAAMSQIRQRVKMAPAKGRMYEVNINADPETLLDWDAPLSQQPENVQRLARRELMTGEYGKYSQRRLGPDPSGAALYREMQTRLELLWKRGQVKPPVGPEGVSEQLRSTGVPGLRYLDQGSRAAGEGTRNYVMFDDSLIDIVRKYGVLGPAIVAEIYRRQQSRKDTAQ